MVEVQIKDLRSGDSKITVSGKIASLGSKKTIEKEGRPETCVATAVLEDETGQINLTLWNEDIDMVSVGGKVRVENGYVNEWQGTPQLTAGKFGKIIAEE